MKNCFVSERWKFLESMDVTMDNYYPMKRKKLEDERDDRDGDSNAKRPYMYQEMHYSTMMPTAQSLPGGGWPPNPMSMNNNRGSGGGYRGTGGGYRGGGTSNRGNRGYFRGNKTSPGRYDQSVLAYSNGPYQYPGYYYPPPWPQGGYESMETDLSVSTDL
ncbi:hypothetical protein J437_LFUL006537 [Ladona fulva]|uniref:Uncharacterized protein n=1 Tax=Ladona fulva TaxID=123851 RepID=A0A8K0P8I9_LADFU|nr:hypothetical protein J437_LFUL006537 [Ladona fulva]